MSLKPARDADAPPPYQAGPAVVPSRPSPAGAHFVGAADVEAAPPRPNPHLPGGGDAWRTHVAAARGAALRRFWGAVGVAWLVWLMAGLVLGGGIADASRARVPHKHRHDWDYGWAAGRVAVDGEAGLVGAARAGAPGVVGRGVDIGDGASESAHADVLTFVER
ncbi:hypothetical protein Q5752_003899 [Cryptotrichosporon argae]